MRVRTAEKKLCIVERAAEVFLELGYPRTTMAEIAARLGGSKATLYSYFDSKEALFFEVVNFAVIGELTLALDWLARSAERDPRDVLTRFGELLLLSVTRPQALAARRMIIAEAKHSDIGRRYWAAGPAPCIDKIAAYLAAAADGGHLKIGNVQAATFHLLSLYESELSWRWMYGMQSVFTHGEIRQVAERAVAVFMAAYGGVPI